jgi:phage terminase small subunit
MPRRITIAELTGLKPQEANFVIEYCKDFSPRRAAEASGWSPDYGHTLKEKPHIAAAIERVLATRLEASHIDAEWVLMEAVDNHMIARQRGNVSASNTALNLVAKHVFVDAFAAEKVEVNSDKEVMDRLMRGRKRREEKQAADNKEDVSFL